MQLDIHHHVVPDTQLLQRLDALLGYVQTITRTQESHMATIKELVASVAEVKGRADSIGKLISQLREQVAGLIAGNLPPDVQQQVDQAFADAEEAKKDLADAVEASPGGSSPVPAAPPDSFSAATGQAPAP